MSLLSLFLFSLFAFCAQAQVPANGTFKFVNEGESFPYIVEYDASYRMFSFFASPFQFGFYNTTPNAFTLALRMGLRRTESGYHWVWEANRGNPVGENATFTFGTDGNLVLADADGRVAWQTNTAKKGVVGIKLLNNGNMVLYNSKGKFVWQSFDYPTDTLLVGQSLGVGAKLVSRLSEVENKDGPYNLVIERKGLSLYYNSNNTSTNTPKPLLYYTTSKWITIPKGSLHRVTLNAIPVDQGHAYELTLDYQVGNSTSSTGSLILARPKYNSTSTMLRLGIDGSLHLYTFYSMLRYGAWETTFSLFGTASGISEDGCQLPERCGKFGLCEDNQCVGCPLSTGVVGWSENCEPEEPATCGAKRYYKLEGVDHFLSKYTKGQAISEYDCSSKCDLDCQCLGYFYNGDASRCWIAYELKTLTKVDKSSHVGFIKYANH